MKEGVKDMPNGHLEQEVDKLIKGLGLAEEMKLALYRKKSEKNEMENEDEYRELQDECDKLCDANNSLLEKLEKVSGDELFT